MAEFLIMALSLRKDSLNKKLAAEAYDILTKEKSSHQYELLSFNDFPMPVYDGDLEAQSGIPASVIDLAEKMKSREALIFSAPEYNGGISGAFKNMIDWLSRVTPSPWAGKQVLLLGASPGNLGAIRGLAHSRVPLESLGVFVFPEVFGLSQAHQAFDEVGKLKDSKTQDRLKKLLFRYCDYVA